MDVEVKADLPLTFKELNEFRKEGKYTDTIIRVDEKSFPCHRAILAASCEYFDKLFGSGFRESNEKEVLLHDVNSEAFAEVLRFIYTARLILNRENIYRLLEISNFLGLKCIEDVCVKHANEHYEIEKDPQLFMFMMLHCKIDSLKGIVKRVARKFELFMKMDLFLDIPANVMYNLIRIKIQQDANFFKSSDVTFAVLNWFKKCPQDRKKTLWRVSAYMSEGTISDTLLQYIIADKLNVAKDELSDNEEEREKYHTSRVSDKLILYCKIKDVQNLDAGILEAVVDTHRKTFIESSIRIVCSNVQTFRTAFVRDKQYFLSYKSNRTYEFWNSDYDTKNPVKASGPPGLCQLYSLMSVQDNLYFYGTEKTESSYGIGYKTYFNRYDTGTGQWHKLNEHSEIDPNSVIMPINDTQLCAFSQNVIKLFDIRKNKWVNVLDYTYNEFAVFNYGGSNYICGGQVKDKYYPMCNYTGYIEPGNTRDYLRKGENRFSSADIIVPFMSKLWIINREGNTMCNIYDLYSGEWRSVDVIPKNVQLHYATYIVNVVEDAVALVAPMR